jgi:cytochrome c oxidase cbb3-type subunit 2
MSIFNDHRKLYPIAGLLFLSLTFFTAIMPALQNQANNAPLPGTVPLDGDALAGKHIYIAEGCVGCHSQQVRNVDMDKVFGSRPGMASDYAHIGRTSIWQNTATLMGTSRIGPDLTDIGNRQGSIDWNLLHLYNPRAVVAGSIMPAYNWMFELKDNPGVNDVVVAVPPAFMDGKTGKVVARKEALQLVAYLMSLKQAPLPGDTKAMEFLYKPEAEPALPGEAVQISGKALYAANCQSCHQANGEGLKGAFPPLKGSPVVMDDDKLELYIDIIMNGYDARAEFGVMPGIGTNQKWTEKEVTAIINFERNEWGNSEVPAVTETEVKKIMEELRNKSIATK